MRYLIAAIVLAVTTIAQAGEVTFIDHPSHLYFCLEQDKPVCMLLNSDGTITRRSLPVGREAIGYDMQNWQWSQQQARSFPAGAEQDKWLQDAVYWETRLLADKAWKALAAAQVPPAFATKETLVDYIEQHREKAKEVLLLESFGLPFHKPVGGL